MSKRLGRGLADLIQASPEQKSANISQPQPDRVQNVGFVKVRVDQLRPGRFQPRTDLDESALDELTESIRRQGVLEPILVRPLAHGTYEVVAGERRMRAARKAGMLEIPVLIKDMEDKQALEVALIENVQRENLNPMEEALGYARLVNEFQYTQEQVAERVGKQRATVANLLRLLKLPEALQKGLREGSINLGHAKVLLGVNSASRQVELFQQCVSLGLSVRALEERVNAPTQAASTSKKVRVQTPLVLDAQQKAIEEQLQLALGTKVAVSPRKKGGRVVIEYFSQEDLDRLLTRLGVEVV